MPPTIKSSLSLMRGSDSWMVLTSLSLCVCVVPCLCGCFPGSSSCSTAAACCVLACLEGYLLLCVVCACMRYAAVCGDDVYRRLVVVVVVAILFIFIFIFSFWLFKWSGSNSCDYYVNIKCI